MICPHCEKKNPNGSTENDICRYCKKPMKVAVVSKPKKAAVASAPKKVAPLKSVKKETVTKV